MLQEFVKEALWYLKDQLISNSKRPVQLSRQAVDLFLELLSVGQNLQQSDHSVDDEGHYRWYTAHAESLKEQFIQKNENSIIISSLHVDGKSGEVS